MSETTQQDTASLIASTVAQTAASMAPLIIQAAANGAMSATTPQGAALTIGAALLTAMIQSQTATASDLESFVKQMAPSIIAGQAAIDAAAAAHGVTDPTQPAAA